MNKLISIITPTFNSVDKLETCILSIKNQTYKNIEHIIIDGGSSDSTIDLIRKYEKEYNIKWLSEKDNGVADAMNKGFEMASGEFFGWIDADNYYNPDIIESIIKNFETTPSINIIYGNVDIVDVDKKVSSYSPPEHISFEKALIYTTGAIPVQPAVFFKREVFEKAKGFDSKYKIAGDFDFWLKVLKKEKNIYYFDKIFGTYLKGDVGISQNRKGIIKGYKEMRNICKKNKQPFYGKVVMFIKYFKGYIGTFIKK